MSKKEKAKTIIRTEGETESIYLNQFRKQVRVSENIINCKKSNHTTPYEIVEEIIKYKNNLIKEEAFSEVVDSCWVLFDGDEHRYCGTMIGKWNNAIQKATENNINLAISNPSIELWFLLGFEYQSANIHRDAVVQKLKKHMPEYAKTKLPVSLTCFIGTSSLITKKIINAKKLRKYNLENKKDDYSNPSTKVDILFEKLISEYVELNPVKPHNYTNK